MRLLITDLNTEVNKDLEKKSAGSGVKIDIFKNANDVTESAWNKADAIITYRGTKNVMKSIALINNAKIIVRGGVGFDGLDLKELGKKGIAAFVKRKRAAQKKGGDPKKGGERRKGQKTIKVKTGT